MIKQFTVGADWPYKEDGAAFTQTYRAGVFYTVSNEVAIAAAKAKATANPEALALLAASGEKPVADPALSKMSKADMQAELKRSRDAVNQFGQMSDELAQAKKDLVAATAGLETSSETIEAFTAQVEQITELFNTTTGSRAKTLADVIDGMKVLSEQG